ncbi:MAG: hypothetical protein HYS26_04355 [Candidatus Kaiserbacteria bacterium]|nr:MAG: hypothetical protein HYS26_04355 [Candidatus Kaiserbacteria bacterium]
MQKIFGIAIVAVGFALALPSAAEARHPCSPYQGGVCGPDHSPYPPPPAPYGRRGYPGKSYGGYQPQYGGGYRDPYHNGYGNNGGGSIETYEAWARSRRTGTYLQFEGFVLQPLDGRPPLLMRPGGY